MNTRKWHAYINLQPGEPNSFYVNGEVYVGNPGIQAELFLREPQENNPKILLLDLHTVQRHGLWPQVATWVQCRYDKILSPNSPRYTDVEVFHDGMSVAQMKVDEVH